MTEMLTGHCHLQGHLFQVGLVDSPGCNRWKQVSETASYILCDYEPLPVLGFRHLGHHFLKPSDFADISVSKVHCSLFKTCGC